MNDELLVSVWPVWEQCPLAQDSQPPGRRNCLSLKKEFIATTFTSYHPDGQVKATWGTHTYPTSRTYDLQGRMKTLSTYRSVPAAQLESATLDLSTHSADLTTWNYEPAGLPRPELPSAG